MEIFGEEDEDAATFANWFLSVYVALLSNVNLEYVL